MRVALAQHLESAQLVKLMLMDRLQEIQLEGFFQ